MPRVVTLVASAILMLAASIDMHAADPAATPVPTAEEARAMQAAATMGARLFVHDRAAAVATDALMEVRGFKRNRQLRGWVTQERGDGIVVTFIGGKKDAEPSALYRVDVGANGRTRGDPRVFEQPEALSPFESAAAKAKSLASDAGFAPCAKKYNSVTLPRDDGLVDWIVYMVPAATEHDIVPLGGSYRFDVDVQAASAESRPYTKSCIQLQSPPNAEGLIASHLLDPVPTDIHVFWSLWSGKPLYVVTTPSESMREIDGGQVMLRERLAE